MADLNHVHKEPLSLGGMHRDISENINTFRVNLLYLSAHQETKAQQQQQRPEKVPLLHREVMKAAQSQLIYSWPAEQLQIFNHWTSTEGQSQ